MMGHLLQNPMQTFGQLTAGAPTATPSPDPFMQQFAKNKVGNPDDLYGTYLQSLKYPASAQNYVPGTGPLSSSPAMGTLKYAARTEIPWLDSPIGHQDLTSALKTYPFTPEASKYLSGHTVMRESADPKVIEEEADTEREKVLGVKTGRDRTDIGTYQKYSPSLSVPTHEMMHSYLDSKGYPYGEDAFNQDWETAKKQTPLLQTIDSYLATSPDYKDEQNRGDLSQERFAYLAQAMSGGGLKAFPSQLQRHYAPIFQEMKPASK